MMAPSQRFATYGASRQLLPSRSSLSDPLISGVLTRLFGSDLDNAVFTVCNRVQWNFTDILCNVFGCIDCDVIRHIMLVYANLALAGTVPEYDYDNRYQVVPVVAKHAGKSIEMTYYTLYELYYATMDDSIVNDAFLRPRYAADHASERKVPEELEEEDCGIFCQLTNTLQTGIIWIAILGGAYLVLRYTPIGEKIKEAVA